MAKRGGESHEVLRGCARRSEAVTLVREGGKQAVKGVPSLDGEEMVQA